eukprot:8680718-Pyramimonas_sp.AAC.1
MLDTDVDIAPLGPMLYQAAQCKCGHVSPRAYGADAEAEPPAAVDQQELLQVAEQARQLPTAKTAM